MIRSLISFTGIWHLSMKFFLFDRINHKCCQDIKNFINKKDTIDIIQGQISKNISLKIENKNKESNYINTKNNRS